MTETTSSIAVARALLEIGAVTFTPEAPVTFKSGISSPVYVDNRRLMFHPPQWRVVIAAMLERLAGAGDDLIIAGVETAGIPHSSALAYAAQLPTVFVRKQGKEHGLKQRIEGGDVTGQRVLLIEDMVSTGESSLSAVAALREAGASVADCLAIITYGFGDMQRRFAAADVRLHTLTTFHAVLSEAYASNIVDLNTARLVEEWLSDPYGWGKR